MNKNDILNYLEQLKPQLSQNGIISLGLFGSYAKNTATSNSDIDIVYQTSNTFIEQHKGWTAFTYLNINLRDKVAKHFNKKVDLFDLNSNAYLKTKVMKSAIYV